MLIWHIQVLQVGVHIVHVTVPTQKVLKLVTAWNYRGMLLEKKNNKILTGLLALYICTID